MIQLVILLILIIIMALAFNSSLIVNVRPVVSDHQSYFFLLFRIKWGRKKPKTVTCGMSCLRSASWLSLLLFSRKSYSPCHPARHPGRRPRSRRCCWVCCAAPRTWPGRWATSRAARRLRGALPSAYWPTIQGSSSVLPFGPLMHRDWHAHINTDSHSHEVRLKPSFYSCSEEGLEDEDGRLSDWACDAPSLRSRPKHAVGGFEEVQRVIWSDEWAESILRTSCSRRDNFMQTWCFKTWFDFLICMYCISFLL